MMRGGGGKKRWYPSLNVREERKNVELMEEVRGRTGRGQEKGRLRKVTGTNDHDLIFFIWSRLKGGRPRAAAKQGIQILSPSLFTTRTQKQLQKIMMNSQVYNL